MQPEFIVTARATWTTTCEHPSGSRHPDVVSEHEEKIDLRFPAVDIAEARIRARILMKVLLIEKLPKPHDNGNSSCSEPKLCNVTLSQVHEFEFEPEATPAQ